MVSDSIFCLTSIAKLIARQKCFSSVFVVHLIQLLIDSFDSLRPLQSTELLKRCLPAQLSLRSDLFLQTMCSYVGVLSFTFRRSVGWKAYIMNLGFYILFLVMLTAMTVLLEKDTENTQSPLLDVPRFTIVVMSLFHLLKEIFQIWDEVSKALNVFLIKVQNAKRNDVPICKNS